MIELSDILEDAERIEHGLRIEDHRAELAPLLRFESNLTEPIHRWFKFKESFSSQLVRHLLTTYVPLSRRSISFLDPFCGVGTSLLAAEDTLVEAGIKSVVLRGVEVNPYMHFVAGTKLAWDKYNPAVMMRAAVVSTNGLHLPARPSFPDLSTMQDRRFVSKKDLGRLLELREKVKIAAKGRPERRPLLLGLAAAAEKVFNLRKDGRALRFVPRATGVSVDDEVAACWDSIAEDLQLGRVRTDTDYRVERADGRRADRVFPTRRFHVILFSPPYLNNIDYTEVYKIELWLLEFLRSRTEMVTQRRRTFRSHPSCLFPEFSDARGDEVTGILGTSFRRLLDYAGHAERWRSRLFTEYFADMLRTLRMCHRLLASDGHVFMVIGNSLHGTSEHPIPVATDLWTCRLARAAGLRVDALLVGRHLARRRIATPLLRESVIIFSKR